jgi:hypothetical protein
MILAHDPTIKVHSSEGSQEDGTMVIEIQDIRYAREDGSEFGMEPRILVFATSKRKADRAMHKALGFDTSNLYYDSLFYWFPNDVDHPPYGGASQVWLFIPSFPGIMGAVLMADMAHLLPPKLLEALYDMFSDLYISGSG